MNSFYRIEVIYFIYKVASMVCIAMLKNNNIDTYHLPSRRKYFDHGISCFHIKNIHAYGRNWIINSNQSSKSRWRPLFLTWSSSAFKWVLDDSLWVMDMCTWSKVHTNSRKLRAYSKKSVFLDSLIVFVSWYLNRKGTIALNGFTLIRLKCWRGRTAPCFMAACIWYASRLKKKIQWDELQ